MIFRRYKLQCSVRLLLGVGWRLRICQRVKGADLISGHEGKSYLSRFVTCVKNIPIKDYKMGLMSSTSVIMVWWIGIDGLKCSLGWFDL